MNMQKYIDIAYQNPRGRLALQIVEANWNDWIDVLRRSVNPQNADRVAEEVFWSAIWGFGVANWSVQEARKMWPEKIPDKGEYPRVLNILDIWLEKIFFKASLNIQIES